jgi:hypothetical protein
MSQQPARVDFFIQHANNVLTLPVFENCPPFSMLKRSLASTLKLLLARQRTVVSSESTLCLLTYHITIASFLLSSHHKFRTVDLKDPRSFIIFFSNNTKTNTIRNHEILYNFSYHAFLNWKHQCIHSDCWNETRSSVLKISSTLHCHSGKIFFCCVRNLYHYSR